ncbi:three-helix bundle dimerization domain-containing protein [Streptomyces sp. NPDC005529]|uniref:three-helix bundle dimerization domain-containing protein n=1 Tax=unclassified Streptomyces TaxID=2593676 RepID=UPI0033BBA552
MADDPGPSNARNAPDAPTGAHSAAGHDDGPGARDGRQDEKAALLHLATRLRDAHPSIEASVVDHTVATAHDAFRQARIRTYVPILVERRARKLLEALEREHATAPTPTPTPMSAPAPAPAPDIVPVTATAFRVVGDQGPAAPANGVER